MKYRRKPFVVEAGEMPVDGTVTIGDQQVEVAGGDYLFYNADGSIAGFAAKAHFEAMYEPVPGRGR